MSQHDTAAESQHNTTATANSKNATSAGTHKSNNTNKDKDNNRSNVSKNATATTAHKSNNKSNHNVNNEPISPHEQDQAKKEDQAHLHTQSIPIKTQRPRISIGVIIFTIAAIIAFTFCVAGNPIGMMDSRTDSSCISIWGPKPRCLGTWFRHDEWLAPDGTKCKKANSLIQAAQAFSVMCIIGGFITVCVALLELFRCAELAVVAVIISLINTVATLVTWSTMLSLYWSNQCGSREFADYYRIGNGLILYIVAWCLQMIGNTALIIDIARGRAK